VDAHDRPAPVDTLWSRNATPPDDPAKALAAAHAFVTRCRAWGLAELERRRQNGKPLHEWESYLRFTDHTLHELEQGTLDAWFVAPPAGPR
jgi:hypothetical protein